MALKLKSLTAIFGLCLLGAALAKSVKPIVVQSHLEGPWNLPVLDDDWFEGVFPNGFKWGYATASYQIEGGWNEDGKGENIWDNFTHREPSPIFDGSSGDVACDSYHKYKEDVQLLKNLGANYYRFSLSWTRILPTGLAVDGVNAAGIAYYNSLIDELIANGIEPMITLYHWDLPQNLEDMGGFLSDDFEKWFGDYAEIAFENFGDRVKTWITFNEPWVQCELGYGEGVNAPGVHSPGVAPYICGHNLLKAHATAYRLFATSFKPSQGGECGITLDASWYEPLFPGVPEYEAAAQRARLFKHGWFAYPIFFGDYPYVMKDLIAAKSQAEGRPTSRLPAFTEEWQRKILGTFDFIGLNHYTSTLVIPAVSNDVSWQGDQDLIGIQDPAWEPAASVWLKSCPWGFRKLLTWIKNTYGNPKQLVTENGWSDTNAVGTEDTSRERYYRQYINEMLKSVRIDGANIQSYTAWSLMDNFEWARGYTERFGVHWVNYTDSARPRIPKESTKQLIKIFKENGFPPGSQ